MASNIVGLVALIAWGCGDSASPGANDGEWPLTAKVNGVAVNASAWVSTSSTSSTVVVNGETASSAATRYFFSLILTKPVAPGTYTLGSYADTMTGYTGRFAYVVIGPSFSGTTYWTQPGYTGTLTVTSYNATTDDMVGTFVFNAATEGAGSSITVTEGRFHGTRP